MLHQSLFKQLSTAVILLDLQGSFCFLNQSAEQALNIGAKQLLGKRFWYFIQKQSFPLRQLMAQLAHSGTFVQDNFQLQLNNGQSLRADLIIQKINLEQEYILIEWQDRSILERHIQDRSRQQQQSINSRLLQNLAHEIKNPLSGIRGAAQLMAMEAPQQSNAYSDIINQEVDRLTNLVDRMLLGHQAASKVTVNIHEILEQAADFISLTLTDSIKLKRDYDPSLPELALAPELIYQAVLNLLQNAVEACLPLANTTIWIKTRPKFKQVINQRQYPLSLEIEITDNGIGVPEEIQDTLFYPLISSKGSSGLGLGISQSIIQQHQGTLQFEPKTDSSCFRILLPIERPQCEQLNQEQI